MRKSPKRFVFAFGAAAVVFAFLLLPALTQVQASDRPENDSSAWCNKWKDQLDKMRTELKRRGHKFDVGCNPAMKHTLEELCGFSAAKAASQGWIENTVPPMEGLPTAFDWRSSNGVTSVKDQANCGSCWAFAMCGAFEAAIRIKDATTVDLSEQNMLNCNSYGYDCGGGFFDANDMHVNPGAVLESCAPYTSGSSGTTGSCNTSCAHPYKLDNWYYVGSASGVPTVDQIKNAIYTYGPISVAVYADSYFQAYTSGIFTRNASGNPNHAIVLVGWDDNGGTDGYWIMKNSWGTGWGESGYMRIKYGVQKIGYAANYVIYSGSTQTPTLSLALSSSTLTVAQSSSGSVTATTTVGGGFNSAVSLSASGVPTGASVSFSPTSIAAPGGGSSTMTVSAGTATAGTYTITVTASGGGLTSTANLSLTVTSSGGGVTTITNGQVVSNISGSSGSWNHYKIAVPASQSQLKVVTSGGSGDADLYVKRGSSPTTSSYDYKSEGSTTAETITISNPASGDWYIGIYGYTSYSGCSLTATYTAPASNKFLNKPVTVSGSYNATTYPPSNMVDGSSSTYWVSPYMSSSTTHWAYVDMGSSQSITQIKMQFSTTNFPKSYYIDYWNGSSWVTKTSSTGNTSGGWKTINYSTAWSAQYIRLRMTVKNSYYYTVYEFQGY
ncbi:MAG: C1 family peptidase [Acidobacteriota bacterium]